MATLRSMSGAAAATKREALQAGKGQSRQGGGDASFHAETFVNRKGGSRGAIRFGDTCDKQRVARGDWRGARWRCHWGGGSARPGIQ